MMALDWEHGALAEGLRCYRNQEFFLAHEHWESVWLRSADPEKSFLQALIQIAAAFHHLERGNSPGAASLLARARRRLNGFPANFGGLNVELLSQSVNEWRQALDCREASPRLPFPWIG
jgi:uncharacterized protein